MKMKQLWNLAMARRGNADGFMALGAGIAVGVVLFVVLAIMLGALQTSQTANSLPYNITGNGLTFLTNATSQFGTAGTILGVSLLLVIIGAIGLGGYGAYKKYS